MQRVETVGGTDVTAVKFMQLKKLLCGRGVADDKLNACPSLQHLRLLGISEGILCDPAAEALDPEEAAAAEEPQVLSRYETVSVEQKQFLAMVAERANTGRISDDDKEMLKEDCYGCLLFLLARVHFLAQYVDSSISSKSQTMLLLCYCRLL